ncbi:MAG: GHKL domain-containing protein [Lachnospiraceae bacterium]|nr:GHKL domain-containing protein [Lachnospiraceae bacterium]
MYNLIDECLDILFLLAQGYSLQFFYGSFLEPRGSKGRAGALTILVFGIWKLGAELLWKNSYKTTVMIAKLFLTMGVIGVIALCFYRALRKITVFLVLTFITVSEISLFLSHMLLRLGDYLFRMWEFFFTNGYVKSPDTYLILVRITAYGLQIVMYTVFWLILFLMLRGIVKYFKDKEYAFHRTELSFILAPVLMGLLFCILLRITIEIAQGSIPKFLYDKYPALSLIIPAILALALLSILYGVKLLQDMIDLSREKSNRIILEKQIRSMQEHMEEMERIYSGVRSMKHDMKNTLSIIMRLSAKEEKEEAACLQEGELQAYLSELNKSMEQLEFRFQTGNRVADTLLNMKYHEIIRMVPDLRMNADGLVFPKALAVQSYDLGIILGNALDNAGEACRKLKEKEPEAEAFILLASFKKGKLLFLKIENSFDGVISQNKTGEFPVTDKADKNAHGIGLANIRNTVEKYQGAVDFKVTDRVFTLSVMIKNEERKEE